MVGLMIDLIRYAWRALISRRSHRRLAAVFTEIPAVAPEVCGQRCSMYGFSCTRPAGHLGPHVATTNDALTVCVYHPPRVHYCALTVPPEIVYAMNQALETHLALAGDTIETIIARD